MSKRVNAMGNGVMTIRKKSVCLSAWLAALLCCNVNVALLLIGEQNEMWEQDVGSNKREI